jgi:hypothetical protein
VSELERTETRLRFARRERERLEAEANGSPENERALRRARELEKMAETDLGWAKDRMRVFRDDASA